MVLRAKWSLIEEYDSNNSDFSLTMAPYSFNRMYNVCEVIYEMFHIMNCGF